MGMELTSAPSALPGCCRLCGSATRTPFVDTKCSEEYHGAVYYCKECVFEMASLYGFISPEIEESLRITIDELISDNMTLADRNVHLEAAINGMVNSGVYSVPSDSVGTGFAVLETSGETESGTQGDENQLGEGEGTTSESSDDEGMDFVHADEQSDDYSLGESFTI